MIQITNFKTVILILFALSIGYNSDKLTTEQRVKIIELYRDTGCQISLTQKRFKKEFNLTKAPSYDTIKLIVEKFSRTGNIADLPRSGRPKSGRSEENIELVRESILEDRNLSIRKRAQDLCLSAETVRRIMREDLKLKPYKIQLVHKITAADILERKNFSIVFKQIWGSENPHAYIEKPLHPKKVSVWCGIMSSKIIGPYFFEDEYGKRVTIDGVRYRRMITDFLVPQIRDEGEIWFQQDGAPPQTANETIDLLKSIFGSNLISKKGSVNWPSRSLDLTPLNFFLWGYLKDRVYKNKPQTTEELKDNIEREIAQIGPVTLKKVMHGTYKRIQNCSKAQGRHLEDVFYSSD